MRDVSPDHLYEPLSTALARRMGTDPVVPTTGALEIAATTATIDAHLAVDGRPDRRVCGMIAVPRAVGIGASQLHTGRLSLLFLQVETLLQPKLQRVSTMRERSIKDMTNVLFYEGNRLGISELRNQKFALHLHDVLMTSRTF